jgi:phospholipase C
MLAHGQISSLQHVMILIQENRSPDNLFQASAASPLGSSNPAAPVPSVPSTIFGGTSAPTAADDAAGTFAMDNVDSPPRVY